MMMTNRTNSDLGSRDMDWNHDWINDARQRCSNIDLSLLMKADTFVKRISGNGQKSTEEEGNGYIADYSTLNDKQKIVFRRIESHYNDMFVGHQKIYSRSFICGGISGSWHFVHLRIFSSKHLI